LAFFDLFLLAKIVPTTDLTEDFYRTRWSGEWKLGIRKWVGVCSDLVGVVGGNMEVGGGPGWFLFSSLQPLWHW